MKYAFCVIKQVSYYDDDFCSKNLLCDIKNSSLYEVLQKTKSNETSNTRQNIDNLYNVSTNIEFWIQVSY